MHQQLTSFFVTKLPFQKTRHN